MKPPAGHRFCAVLVPPVGVKICGEREILNSSEEVVMPRLLLLNHLDDTSAVDNWGIQALFYALPRMLHEAIPDLAVTALPKAWLLKQFRKVVVWPHPLLEADVRLPSFTPWPLLRLSPAIDFFIRRCSRVAEFFPEIVDDFDYVADRWLAGDGGPMAREFIAAARQADVVVHHGENQIYRNSLEGCRALFLLWFARTRLNKPSCEINHTAQLTSVRPVMPGMVRFVYPQLDVVTVREPSSLDNLRALGINKATLVPDSVFYLDPHEFSQARASEWKRSVGLDGQPFFCLSASGLAMSAPRARWEGAVTALVESLKRVVPKAVLIAKDRSCGFLEQVARITNSAFFGPEHAFADLWPLLREARFLVSGHYHNVIMGSMVGCPFVPLSTTSHKMDGVCRYLNWHVTAPFDATSLRTEGDAIVAEADRLNTHRDEYANHLLARSAQLRRDAAQNAILVREALMPS